MKQDPFIDQLTSGLQKAPPPPSLWKQVLIMFVMSAGAGLTIMRVCGVRPDLGLALERGSYLIELSALIGFALIAYWMADASATPGRIRNFTKPLLILAAIIVLVLGLLMQHPSAEFPAAFWSGSHCLFLIIISGLLPLLLTLRMLRRAAATRPQLTTALALFGSFGAAVVVQHMVCPSENIWHLISWHLGIFPLSALAAWMLGRRILRW